MKILSNYHSHCNFCDGSSPMEDYIIEAVNQGLPSYGFSSHVPIPYASKWSMKSSALSSYLRGIDALKQEWKNVIEIYKSLEFDYIPNLTDSLEDVMRKLDLDYTIGSIHFIDFLDEETPWEVDGSNDKFERGFQQIFNGDIRKVIERYYQLTQQMVRVAKPTIIGHLDKIKIQNYYKPYFSEDEAWYIELVEETLQVIKDSGRILEVNTRGWYKNKTEEVYPSKWILQRANELKIPVVINADAHSPHEISAGFSMALKTLEEAGYQHVFQMEDGLWQPQAIEKFQRVKIRV